jgi:hypothetical protein
MRDPQLDPWSEDGLEQAIALALDAVLRRRLVGRNQAEMLKVLRWQLEKVLAEAPSEGDAMEVLTVRARLAALCAAEITKIEARVY